MDMPKEFEKCSKCGCEITENNFGNEIEAEEIFVCSKCEEKHCREVIATLESFRKSNDFKSILALRNQIQWLREKMGNWHDNADKSSMGSVTDFEDKDLIQLQNWLIADEITIIEGILLRTSRKSDRYIEALDKELRKEQKRLCSIISEGC